MGRQRAYTVVLIVVLCVAGLTLGLTAGSVAANPDGFSLQDDCNEMRCQDGIDCSSEPDSNLNCEETDGFEQDTCRSIDCEFGV